MNATVPGWLNLLAWVWIALALASAAAIVLDFLRGRRQPMRIMEVVWPVTALYFGPIAVLLYLRFAARRQRATRRANSPPGKASSSHRVIAGPAAPWATSSPKT